MSVYATHRSRGVLRVPFLCNRSSGELSLIFVVVVVEDTRATEIDPSQYPPVGREPGQFPFEARTIIHIRMSRFRC